MLGMGIFGKILCSVILYSQQKEKPSSGIIKNLKKGFWKEAILANILPPFFFSVLIHLSFHQNAQWSLLQQKKKGKIFKEKLKNTEVFPSYLPLHQVY